MEGIAAGRSLPALVRRRLLLRLLLRLSLLRLLLLRLLGLRQGQHRYAGAERKAYSRKPDGPPHARETSCE